MFGDWELNEINETDGCSRGMPSAFSLEPVALLQSIFDRSLFVVPQCLRLRGDDSPLGLKIDAVLELLVVIYVGGASDYKQILYPFADAPFARAPRSSST